MPVTGFGAGGNQRLVHRHMTGGLNLQVAGGGVGIAFGGSCALLAVGQPPDAGREPTVPARRHHCGH